VDTGAQPADYAGHMLDLAYFQKERLLLTGLFITIGRRTILEQRILNVLSMKRNNLSKKGGMKMKIRGINRKLRHNKKGHLR
jgi:hypothetical protein